MPLTFGSDSDVWALVESLKRSFGKRDRMWAQRRRIRYRQMGRELESLPLNPRIKDTALMTYQSDVPNQETHKRVKRLVANPPRLEVVIYDDAPATQRLGQDLEDGLKALLGWMEQHSPFHRRAAQHQMGDGLGILKIDFIPGHGSVLADYDLDVVTSEEEDETDDEGAATRNRIRTDFRDRLLRGESPPEAYDKMTDGALRTELPPYRMVAVDPLACYWWEDDDGIEVIAEVGKKSLNPLLDALRGYGLSLENNRLIVRGDGSEAIGGPTMPDSRTHSDLGSQVTFVEIRTRTQVILLIEHPKIKGMKRDLNDKGVILRFDNPFGPYTTGYALIAGDETTEVEPALRYQPPILAALNAAQAQNVLMTARLSASLEDALSPEYIKVSPEVADAPTDEDKTPTVNESREIPVIPGEIKRIESLKTDLAQIDQRIMLDASVGAFQDVLQGDAKSEATGHRLAIQVSQADIQMVPYQNSRALALKELLKGIIYSIRKHSLPIYIPTVPGGRRSANRVQVAQHAVITPEMADMDFELIVTLGAETPMTKYAREQHLRDQEEAGTVGYQTVVEASAENPEDEIKRVFEGKMLKAVMDRSIPLLADALLQYIEQKLAAAQGQGGGGEAGQLPFQATPETGLAGGGGAGPIGNPADVVRLPGVNMPVTQTVQSGPGAGTPESPGTGSVGY